MVWSEGNMSLKNPVTPPGIDPGTVQLVAQRLNHYATPGPHCFDIWKIICDLDEETKADYKQFQQLLSINKRNRSD